MKKCHSKRSVVTLKTVNGINEEKCKLQCLKSNDCSYVTIRTAGKVQTCIIAIVVNIYARNCTSTYWYPWLGRSLRSVIFVNISGGKKKRSELWYIYLISQTIWCTSQPPNLAHNDFHLLHISTQNYSVIAVEMREQRPGWQNYKSRTTIMAEFL
jgi:hypothetical protein